MRAFIHSFIQQTCISAYYVPGTRLRVKDTKEFMCRNCPRLLSGRAVFFVRSLIHPFAGHRSVN